MSKKFDEKKYLILATIFAVGFFFLPLKVYSATTIYFDLENPVIYEGDTFLVDLKISTRDKSVNVVDGTILYDKSRLEIKEVSTGNSLFALWPKSPIFSNQQGSLSFTGGALGGFQGEKGEILRIIFLAKGAGEAKIDSLNNFAVFLHDGQGTQINPQFGEFSINILKRPLEIPVKDEWQDLVLKDKTPPESFEITLAKDPAIFDNQHFISFFTTDVESGIAYYEVQEGKKDFVRTESPYLLQDQLLKKLIKVKAVDKAGNERIEELLPPTATAPFYKNILFWIILSLIIIVIYYVFWRKHRRKNKK